MRRKFKKRSLRRPPLSVPQILEWADAHYQRTGKWPSRTSGPVLESLDTWGAINGALNHGGRGLSGHSSLPQLLAKHRGVRNKSRLPRLSLRQILAWADAHHHRFGKWPISESGGVPDAPGETWKAVDLALRHGRRGLSGGSSLAKLLATRRGVRNNRGLPPLSEAQILAWADAHRQHTGEWPNVHSGRVIDATDETWFNLDKALRVGVRGLKGDSSLSKLLTEQRGVRSPTRPPKLTLKQVREWAEAHHRRTGKWPSQYSGAIADAPGETWKSVDTALRLGLRGLPGGSSLARLRGRVRKMPLN